MNYYRRLEKFKTEEQKLYQKILETLQLLGDFPKKIEVQLYESIVTENENDSNYPGAWEFPEGHLEFGETIKEGLKRKLKK